MNILICTATLLVSGVEISIHKHILTKTRYTNYKLNSFHVTRHKVRYNILFFYIRTRFCRIFAFVLNILNSLILKSKIIT